MPRKKRQESPTQIYHWITRGVNKNRLFRSKSDFKYYLKLLIEYKEKFSIEIYHFCLMTNHVHMLVKSPTMGNLSSFTQIFQRKYAYYYAKSYKWPGQVFQRIFTSLPIDDERYLLECARYIERNPIKAGLVLHPADYPYSSFSRYIKERPGRILSISPAYLNLNDTKEVRVQMYNKYVTENRIQEEMQSKGLVLV